MAAPILLCDTAGMDRTTWLAARMHGPKGNIPFTIGGSDVGAVFGVNPWVTPLELWRVKAGLDMPDEETNSDQKEMGKLLEPIVAHWYGRKTGNTVIPDTGLYQHRYWGWALANLDYRFETLDGLKGILECKTTTYYKASEWEDDCIPYYYELQGRFYMAVMDLDVCDICCMWGNNPERDIVVRRIHRDRTIEAIIFTELRAFIDSLKANQPPSMEGVAATQALEALAKIYAKTARTDSMDLPLNFEAPLRRISALQGEVRDLKKQINEKEKEVDELSVQIAETLKDNQYGQLSIAGERFLVDYRTRTMRRADIEKLKKQYASVYNDVLKVSTSRYIKVLREAV